MAKQTFLKRLTDAVSPGPPTTGDLARKAASQRGEIAKLEQRKRELALDVESGLAGAGSELESVKRELATAQDRLGTLEDALTEARSREERATANAKKELWRTRFNAFQKHAERRLNGARKVAEGIATLVAGYSEFHSATTAMNASHPENKVITRTLFRDAHLALALRDECSRHYSGDLREPGRVPFAAKDAFHKEAIVPFAEKIAAENASLIAELRGKE